MHSERGVRSLLGGVMLCPQGPSLHHGLCTLLLLGFGGLCVHSGGYVRGLLGNALCCVLRRPACTMDYPAYVGVWRAVSRVLCGVS